MRFVPLAFPEGGNNIPGQYYTSPEGKQVELEACEDDCASDDKCDTILWHSCFKICKKYAVAWKPAALPDPCCQVYQRVDSPGNSSNLLLGVVLCLCLYAALGAAAGYAREGRLQHIHATQWRQVRDLCVDGLAFTRSGGKAAAARPHVGAGAPLLLVGASAASAPVEEDGKRHKPPGKKEGKKRSKPASKSAGCESGALKRGKGSGGGETEERTGGHRHAQGALPGGAGGNGGAAATGRGGGTASGGGGRWVHIPT
jgi:hypothetical protein